MYRARQNPSIKEIKMNNQAHHYNPTTLLYTHSSDLVAPAGYKEPLIPQCALLASIPAYNTSTQYLKANVSTGEWQVLDKQKEVTAYHKKTQAHKVFDDKSLIDEYYTSIKPSSRFDKFENEGWVLDENLKFTTEEHEWVVSELLWYDSKITYAQRGDMKRSGGHTKEQLDSYATSLCDYTSKDGNGVITVIGDTRPSI